MRTLRIIGAIVLLGLAGVCLYGAVHALGIQYWGWGYRDNSPSLYIGSALVATGIAAASGYFALMLLRR